MMLISNNIKTKGKEKKKVGLSFSFLVGRKKANTYGNIKYVTIL